MPIFSRFFHTFSSIRFSVSGFMLRSLIHLDLSFVQGYKYGSVFIFLHRGSQLDQHQLLKMLSFFHCTFFYFFVKDQVSVSMWFYFWVSSPIPLTNMSASVAIPCSFFFFLSLLLCSKLEVRDGDSPSCSFIVPSVVSPCL